MKNLAINKRDIIFTFTFILFILIIPIASASHNSTSTVAPVWLTAQGGATNYTFNIANSAGSANTISDIFIDMPGSDGSEIYNGATVTSPTNWACSVLNGSNILADNISCTATTSPARIGPGSSLNFFVKTTNPSFDGKFNWNITTTDTIGGTSGSIIYTGVDTIAPSNITLNDPGNFSTTGSATWNWSASTDATSGVNKYQFQLSTNAGFSSLTQDVNVTSTNASSAGLSEGTTYYARVRAYDNATNTGNFSNTRNITIDIIAPSLIFNAPAANSYFRDGNQININVSATDATSGIAAGNQCSVFMNNSGNTISVPGSVTYNPSAGGCTGSVTIPSPSNLSDGTVTLRISVQDIAGNSGQASRNESIDNTVPLLSVCSVSNNIVRSDFNSAINITCNVSDALSGVNNVTALLQQSDNVTQQFITMSSVGNRQYLAQWTPSSVFWEAEGTVYIDINTSDNINNAKTYDNVQNITIDNTAPVLTVPIPSNRSYVYGSASQLFSINVNESVGIKNATVYYKRSSVTDFNLQALSCASNVCNASVNLLTTYADQDVISFYFEVYDNSGNLGRMGNPSALLTTIIDRTSPSFSAISVHSDYNSNYTNATPTINATATDVGGGIVSCQYSINNGTSYSSADWNGTNCVITLPSQSDGSILNITMRATDAAGNTGNSTLLARTVDAVSPTIVNANITFTETSQFDKDGLYKIVWSNASDDKSGIALYELEFDSTAPYDFSDATKVQNAISPYNVIYATNGSEDGTFYYRIRAKDNVGNLASFSALVNITRDTLAPRVTILKIYHNSTNTAGYIKSAQYFRIEANITEDNSTGTASGFDTTSVTADLSSIMANNEFSHIAPNSCNLNSCTWYRISGSNLVDGNPYSIAINVSDRAGNSLGFNQTSAIADDTAPTLTIINITDPHYNISFRWYKPARLTSGLFIKINSTDTGSGLASGRLNWNSSNDADDQFNLDIGTQGNFTVTNLTDDGNGNITISITMTDKLGNSNNVSLAVRFDAGTPAIAVIKPNDGEYLKGTINVNVTVSDNESGVNRVELYIDNVTSANLVANTSASGQNFIIPWNTNKSYDGSHVLYAKVYDNVENSNNWAGTNITIASAAVSTFINNSLSTLNNTITVNAAATNSSIEINTIQNVSDGLLQLAQYNSSTHTAPAVALNKYLVINASPSIENNLSSAIVKVYYSDAEISTAGLDENTLRLYFFNETSGSWIKYDSPFGGVDTSANFVFANTTHFSEFGIFGSALPAPTTSSGASSSSGGGGGGGGGEFVYPSKKEPSQKASELPVEKPPEQPQQPATGEESKEKVKAETVKEATTEKTKFLGITGFSALNIIQQNKSIIGVALFILLLLGAGILLIKKPGKLSPDEYYDKSAQLQKNAKEKYMRGNIEEANKLYKKAEEFRNYAKK